MASIDLNKPPFVAVAVAILTLRPAVRVDKVNVSPCIGLETVCRVLTSTIFSSAIFSTCWVAAVRGCETDGKKENI